MAMVPRDQLTPGLPPHLEEEIRDLREQCADLLQFATRGGRGRESELRDLQRRLGALLAREARRPPDKRGVRMVSLALSVSAAFPELRTFEARERRRREQIAATRAISRRAGKPA